MLGLWWIANPEDETDNYEPPGPSERLPGDLHEVSGNKFALETIGFLGNHLFQTDGTFGPVSSQSHVNIWGTDRGGKYVSLLNCLKTNSTRRFPHVESGHEDWSVGWHAQGEAWVTPDNKCGSACIRTDDLQAWTLYLQSDKVTVDNANRTAQIDLREETLGTTTVGDVTVSLIRRAHINRQRAWDTHGPNFSVENVVNWKLEGPLTLKEIADEWAEGLEWFARFMTMEPSVISGIDCQLPESDRRALQVALTIPRLPRTDGATKKRTDTGSSPDRYLMTLATFAQHGLDLMSVFNRYWTEVVTGDSYTAMALHLDSQDRLMNRGVDVALLNAIRSIEMLYALKNPGKSVERIGAQEKVNSAIGDAGKIGSQILDAWPALSEVGVLRRDVAHGRARPSSDFGLRCIGGAMSIQWLQRLHLLIAMGVDEPAAHSIIQANQRFMGELELLKAWSAEL